MSVVILEKTMIDKFSWKELCARQKFKNAMKVSKRSKTVYESDFIFDYH